MIAITITPAAYKALRVMRPETYDAPAGADGMIRIWLDRKFFDQLGQMKAPGESYSGSYSGERRTNAFSDCAIDFLMAPADDLYQASQQAGLA